ncbi:MAG: phosphoadenosine phosphosulfate reductase family protein [Planctomycetes bacterium]|nr:phosphoadenosine phosphosulfate reductase family protein [Planctomycetota bacterium]
MQKRLFEGAKQTLLEAIDLTAESLLVYGPSHRHWAIAWSGGKDSSALLTVVMFLIESGRIPSPETLTVLYADTRMELLPLSFAAMRMIAQLRSRGVDVRVVLPEMDERFFVYMLGRGVPPPSNTFRWCTPQIKVEPMQAELSRLVGAIGGKVLMLTGVRVGESASRDSRISMACGVNGAECGQGWYQETLPESLCDTLAPLLHWRVCNVWEWLRIFAPSKRYGGWDTGTIADAYGGEEAEEKNARTGCVGCALCERDMALDLVLTLPEWEYLQPLKGLKPLYRELKLPRNRLRKPGGETRADGTLVKNQYRMGPLTMDARRMGLARILEMQAAVNAEATRTGRPPIDILDSAEVARIKELIDANTWPRRWDGTEPRADEPTDEGGPTLFDELEEEQELVNLGLEES